jgi:signal peptidase II
MVWTIILILLAAADQLIKAIVNRDITTSGRITVIDGFFYLINRKNRGAAWSFLANQDWGIYILAAISGIVTIVLLVVLYRSHHWRLRACLTMIIAGSIGNFIDRVRDLAVTDYLDFHFGDYVFPTFNLADMLVVCGTILLSLLILLDPQVVDLIILRSAKPSTDLATPAAIMPEPSAGLSMPAAELPNPSADAVEPAESGKDGESS